MQTPTEAIVVLWAWDERRNAFPKYMGRLLTKAASLHLSRRRSPIILCGGPPYDSLARKMRQQLLNAFSNHPDEAGRLERPGAIILEEYSSSLPDSWLQLRLNFPSLTEVTVVTLPFFEEYHTLVGRKVFGRKLRMYLDTPDALSINPPPTLPIMVERELAIVKCILEPMRAGSHRFLLEDDNTSKWPALLQAHRYCSEHRHLYPTRRSQRKR